MTSEIFAPPLTNRHASSSGRSLLSPQHFASSRGPLNGASIRTFGGVPWLRRMSEKKAISLLTGVLIGVACLLVGYCVGRL